MKLLIAVLSCQRDIEKHDIVRSTWGAEAKALGIPTQFFVGPKFVKYQSDETHLSCNDTRAGLPYKLREVCKWATGKSIDNIFVSYVNSHVFPAYLYTHFLATESADYAGTFDRPIGKTFRHTAGEGADLETYERCYPWAGGAQGYLLSRKAFTEIASEHPKSQFEDLFVGQILGPLAALGEIVIKELY